MKYPLAFDEVIMQQQVMAFPTSQVAIAPSERRASVRFSCALGTTCRPIASTRENSWTGTIRNVSQGGIGLVLNRRFEAGTLLSVELQSPLGESVGAVLARVVHSRQQGPV